MANTGKYRDQRSVAIQTFNPVFIRMCGICGRRGGLMVSAPDSGSSGPGSRPDWGTAGVLRQDTLLS